MVLSAVLAFGHEQRAVYLRQSLRLVAHRKLDTGYRKNFWPAISTVAVIVAAQ